ncbi:integrase core domain-containing protein [Enterobacter sp. BIDMC93]|uniref:integrase core domain-containing protein n=1 Tax=Enterobacter sp. BIDMC93 TaxID=1686396 RepID=UPI0009E219E6
MGCIHAIFDFSLTSAFRSQRTFNSVSLSVLCHKRKLLISDYIDKRGAAHRKTINDWRLDYNECRPHSSLNYQTPAEFAAGWRNGKYEEKPTDIMD